MILLPCPNCGARNVSEFRFGGEVTKQPAPDETTPASWARYLYMRKNVLGVQREWWYHRAGCRRWFLAVRDTRSNEVARTFWPGPPGEPPA